MPATYTHYYFGKKVLSKLPKAYQDLINAHRDLYDIGQHGPDLLFYHYPLNNNPIKDIGYKMHDKSGKAFFSYASTIHQNREADLAYLYGFICHFTLDAYCHPYVESYIKNEGVSHFQIEMQLDRYLLEKEGFNVFKYPMGHHLHPSNKNEQVIAPYFKITTPKDIHRAIVQMIGFHRLFKSSSDFKRWFLYTVMDLLRVSKYKEQIISKYPNPKCLKSNQELDALIEKALPKAVELIERFVDDGPIDELYNHTFGDE